MAQDRLMAWTAPATVTTNQLMTAAFWNAHVGANQSVLRAGGMALASQGAGDLLYASSPTQIARLAAADGTPFFGGSSWSFSNIVSALYPVGTVYTTLDSTNPNTVFGFGTWIALGTGRVLVGFDAYDPEFSGAEQAGGEKTHTLLATELPSHTHPVTDPGHAHQVGFGNVDGEGGGSSQPNPRSYPSSGSVTSSLIGTGLSVGAAGGGGAHNNLAPYITVYFWKRTA